MYWSVWWSQHFQKTLNSLAVPDKAFGNKQAFTESSGNRGWLCVSKNNSCAQVSNKLMCFVLHIQVQLSLRIMWLLKLLVLHK